MGDGVGDWLRGKRLPVTRLGDEPYDEGEGDDERQPRSGLQTGHQPSPDVLGIDKGDRRRKRRVR